jgi:hypothetical protein
MNPGGKSIEVCVITGADDNARVNRILAMQPNEVTAVEREDGSVRG